MLPFRAVLLDFVFPRPHVATCRLLTLEDPVSQRMNIAEVANEVIRTGKDLATVRQSADLLRLGLALRTFWRSFCGLKCHSFANAYHFRDRWALLGWKRRRIVRSRGRAGGRTSRKSETADVLVATAFACLAVRPIRRAGRSRTHATRTGVPRRDPRLMCIVCLHVYIAELLHERLDVRVR